MNLGASVSIPSLCQERRVHTLTHGGFMHGAVRIMQVVRVIPERAAHCERHEEVNEVSVAWRGQQIVVTVVTK